MNISIQKLIALAFVVLFFCVLREVNATEVNESADEREKVQFEGNTTAMEKLVFFSGMGEQRTLGTYNFLFFALAASQKTDGDFAIDYEELRRLVNSMISTDKITPTEETVEEVMSIFRTSIVEGHVADAKQFVRVFVDVAKLMITSSENSTCVEHILRVVQTITQKRIGLFRHELRGILYLSLERCQSLRGANCARKVFGMIKEQGIARKRKDKRAAYFKLFWALSGSTDFAADQRMYFDEMVRDGIRPEITMLGPLMAMWDGNDSLLALRNSEWIYVSMIEFCISPQGVWRLVERHISRKENWKHRDAIYHKAIEKFLFFGDTESVITFVDNYYVTSRNIETYHILFRTFANATSARNNFSLQMERYVHRMIADDEITPTKETLMTVLSVFEGTGYAVEATGAVREILTFGRMDLTEEGEAGAILGRIYERAIERKGNTSTGDLPNRQKWNLFIETMEKHEPLSVLKRDIVSCQRAECVIEMLRRLDNSVYSDWKLQQIYEIALQLLRCGGLQDANGEEEVLRMMGELGLTQSLSVLKRGMVSCQSAECVVRMLHQLRNSVFSDRKLQQIYEIAMRRCRDLHDANGEEEVFRMMRDIDVGPPELLEESESDSDEEIDPNFKNNHNH